MSKAVAIPYIIALVIGLIVLVFIIYWVYKAFSTPVFSIQDCKNKFAEICTMCMNRGWDKDYVLSLDLQNMIKDCANKYGELWYWSDNLCCGSTCCGPGTCGDMKGDCERLLIGH